MKIDGWLLLVPPLAQIEASAADDARIRFEK
jgi:hypothetical protein